MISTNEDARKYFESEGLSYGMVREHHFYMLVARLSEELSEFTFSPQVYTDKGNMKINKKTLRCQTTSKGLKKAFIEVDGPYFKSREGISFNADGFIGFAGWSDSHNVQPFINAFVKWIDDIKESLEETE